MAERDLMPVHLQKDMQRFRDARADSIIEKFGASRANEDALVKLRREIVKECQEAITKHIAEMKQRTSPHDLLAIAGAEKELLGVHKAMERLKDYRGRVRPSRSAFCDFAFSLWNSAKS